MMNELLKELEGLRLRPYLCPSGIWTIGYGHVIYFHGRQLKGEPDKKLALKLYPNGITETLANEMLRQDIQSVKDFINKNVLVELSENQLSSLVSFVFNIGYGSFSKSTLLKKLNKGNYNEVPNELRRWNKATVNGRKVVLKGLTNRREKEINLWLS